MVGRVCSPSVALVRVGSTRLRHEPLPSSNETLCGCEPVFVNADARGYYVSEYTPEAVRALVKRAPALTRVERLSLANDEWWLTQSARHPIGVFLDLAGEFATDDTPAILDTLEGRLGYVAANIVDGSQQSQFQRWIRARFGPVLTQLGLSADPRDPDHLLGRRATLMSIVGVTGGDANVQRQARALANQYLSNAASVGPTMASSILQVAAYSGDRALYDRYVAKLPALTSQPEEYYRYFNALGWFADPAVRQEVLKLSLSPSVRSQDTGTLLRGMLRLPWAREATWKFVKEQWAALVAKLGVFQGIPGVVSGLQNLCSTADANDVRAFFAKNPVEAVERGVRQAVESIETCARIDARQSASLASWLAQR